MDLNKSAYLLALAELKSFSKAAEKCYVSQPALTRYIKNLEEEVGLKLVDRSSSPVRLTYAGERYVEGLRKIMVLKDQLDREMAAIANRRKDRLTIGMHSTRCYSWLPRILPAYQAECPDIDVKLVEGNTADLEQRLMDETIDVFFMCPPSRGGNDLEFVRLFGEEMALVISRSLPLFAGLALPPNESGVLQYIPPRIVEQIPFISPTPIHGIYHLAKRLFTQYQIHPQVAMELVNTSTAYRLVPQNKGFAFAPVTVTYEESFDQVPLFGSMEETVSSRDIGLLYKKGSALSPAAESFVRIAAQVIPRFVEEHIPHFEVRRDIDFSRI